MANAQGQAFEDLRNTLNEGVRILRHRWRLALVGFTVVGAAAFWGSQYLPREYTAATIFERRDDVVLQNLIQNNSPYSFDHLRSTLTLDMIGSRAQARSAVRAGLLPAERFTGEGALSDAERAALDGLLARYQLEPRVRLLHSSPSLDTIALDCTSNNPAVARAFVVALRDSYIEQTRDRIREILSGTREFFLREIERLQKELARTDESLRTGFEDFPGVDPTDIAGVGSRLEALRMQRDTAWQRKAELEAQIAAREQFLVTAGAALAAGTAVSPALLPTPPQRIDPALEKGIDQVRSELVELVTGKGMTLAHPEVKRLRSRLEALEDLRATMLAAAEESAPDAADGKTPETPVASGRSRSLEEVRVELELDSLRRQLAIAERQFADIEGRVTRFATLYDQLLNDAGGLRELREKQGEHTNELAVWQTHLTQLDRVLAAESGQRGTQFALIEEPKDVSRPTRPRIHSIFLVCTGLGLAAGALLVALAELLDRSFRSIGQVTRALGVPVLECVGVIPTPRERRRVVLSRVAWAPALVLLVGMLLSTAGLAYVSLTRPDLYHKVLDRVGVASVLRLGEPSSEGAAWGR